MPTPHPAITEEKAFHLIERLEALATEEGISLAKLVECCHVILRRKDDIMQLASSDPGKPSISVQRTLYCSFCNNPQHAVKLLITGDNVFICDKCVSVCNEVLREREKSREQAR